MTFGHKTVYAVRSAIEVLEVDHEERHYNYRPRNEKPEEVDYNQIYFEHFFPNVKGKAKLCDEYLSEFRSPYYLIVKNSKIKFHLEDEDDPDVLVSIQFE